MSLKSVFKIVHEGGVLAVLKALKIPIQAHGNSGEVCIFKS